MKKEKAFTTTDFRAELKKWMPGFKWTVHKQRLGKDCFEATGTQSAGFNRTGTMFVERHPSYTMGIRYEAKVAGYGKKSKWISTFSGQTLRQVLRGIQSNCEWHARDYRGVANMIQNARKGE